MLAMPDADSTSKSAREEAREILEGMSISELQEALHRIGHKTTQKPGESDEQWKQRAIRRLLRHYDIEESLRFKVCRGLGIPTDDDRRMKLMYEATIAARDSADASARSAKYTVCVALVGMIGLVIAATSLFISYLAFSKNPQPAPTTRPVIDEPSGQEAGETDHSRDAGPTGP